MAKVNKLSDKEEVSLHIKKLDKSIRSTIEYLRKIILSCDKQIDERIKWNNPSFYFNGTMKPFDPKEYKREIIVFNLHKNRIMLVFPSGAKLKNASNLLKGDYKDGRRIVIFVDLKDVKTKEKFLKQNIKEWIKLIDK